VDKREALPLQESPALENYHNINSLGFSRRARAHLSDLAKESNNWETDDDNLDDRNEFTVYEFEISLLTQRIERYKLSLSLSKSSLSPNAAPYCPEVVSQKREAGIESCSFTSDGPVSFQDPGCNTEVEACLKVEYIELVEYLSNGGSYEVDSGTSSVCPTKMGERVNGSSHCPLPKVVVRSEEDIQKLSMNQLNLSMKPNIRVPYKALTGASQVLSPQELQLAYEELLVYNPLTSAAERRLLEELKERHEENEVQQSSDSYIELFIYVQTLMDYDEYKYDLIHGAVDHLQYISDYNITTVTEIATIN